MRTIEMNRVNSSATNHADERFSLAGCVLVASPAISDGLFGRSVCIVIEHSEKHAVGIVLNKRLEIDANSLAQLFMHGLEKPLAGHINFGGPQSGPILAIHEDKDLAEGGNNLGIYLSVQVDHLKQLAQSSQRRFRLFAGHAVWGATELDHQVIAGNWHVLPAVPELIFDDESQMWPKAIRTVANQILSNVTGFDVSTVQCSKN
jgi:putative transcriptional regulator